MKPFAMERWQSRYENVVRHNLSESGVHPLSLGELLELAGATEEALATSLGYGQSNGTEVLRERIAGLYDDAAAANVVVTNGSAEANMIAAWRVLETAGPGDNVAVLLPTYMQLPGLADAFGAEVRGIHLREEEGWQPDPDEVRAAVDHRTRMIVVTNPQNPTGVVLDPQALDAVIESAERVGAWILADEVYAGAERSGGRTPSLWDRAGGPSGRVLATGSLSKAYGLPGLRIGWVLAPDALAEDLWGRKDYTTIGPGALTDHLAALALRDDVMPRIVERTRAIIRDHLEITVAWMNDVGRFAPVRHDAGAVCFPRYELPVDSGDLAERLRVEQDVLIVPGSHFEMGPYLRIGFGIERRPLEEALDRVGTLIRGL